MCCPQTAQEVKQYLSSLMAGFIERRAITFNKGKIFGKDCATPDSDSSRTVTARNLAQIPFEPSRRTGYFGAAHARVAQLDRASASGAEG